MMNDVMQAIGGVRARPVNRDDSLALEQPSGEQIFRPLKLENPHPFLAQECSYFLALRKQSGDKAQPLRRS